MKNLGFQVAFASSDRFDSPTGYALVVIHAAAMLCNTILRLKWAGSSPVFERRRG